MNTPSSTATTEEMVTPERAYFERGFIAAAAWAMTKRANVKLSDAVIDHAWAHRDEGMDEADMLPPIRQHDSAGVPDGLVERLEAASAFLDGRAPLDGCSFGDKHPSNRGNFWWRSSIGDTLNDTIAALSARPSPPKDHATNTDLLMLRALLCLSGFAGRGWSVNDYEEPADVYSDIAQAIGMEDADDNDLRAHIAIEQNRASTTRGAEDTQAEVVRLREQIINTPETADFMAGVPIEAAHQRDRWGVQHDGGKTPEDWFWLIGYLSQKALHHTISTAAALANWHAAIAGVDTSMRPGIEPPAALHGEGSTS